MFLFQFFLNMSHSLLKSACTSGKFRTPIVLSRDCTILDCMYSKFGGLPISAVHNSNSLRIDAMLTLDCSLSRSWFSFKNCVQHNIVIFFKYRNWHKLTSGIYFSDTNTLIYTRKPCNQIISKYIVLPRKLGDAQLLHDCDN